ncbi:hypothetical protein CPB85DRAFT_1437194 [Mucidula mucida]|nr:hypothetical protein CPB85DRAFT_1437194 [Mucidula mucida]
MTLPQTEQRLENETITHASPPLDMPTGEEPPDGTDIVSEWQEGPHRVVERRAGPGEDVGRSRGSQKLWRRGDSCVHEQAKKLKAVPRVIEEGVSKFEKKLGKEGNGKK